MIAIGEYEEKSEYNSLKNVKDDLINFRELFETTLKYEFVCKDKNKLKMTKDDVREFLDEVIYKFKLRKNLNGYDGLIFILCGHGDDGNVLVTSEGDSLSIDKIHSDFNCNEMSSLKDIPKIFIINACRGKKMPKSHIIGMRAKPEDTKRRLYYGHNDDGFFTIWSTTNGHIVKDSPLFSKCIKEVIAEMCEKGYSLNQMLREIRDRIQKSNGGEWYCVESQDTMSYDILFSISQFKKNPPE
ncbi:caspase-1 [Reticulomyxa filosa]|uniref:Caspase-1 n=1 Tax=Reticulomyxa filosa TaxID=46433 RepID=X6LD02_RETFI|nr:caspase-1 [Reticulomyxa filosa]|eukprot:ETN98996.1 caspase-1 [Reticulomyxa filosa]